VSFGYQFQHLSNGDDGFNMPVGLNIDAALPVGSRLSIVGQFDWSRKSESETLAGTSVEATLSATTYGGGVRWTGRAPSVAPYIDVLFGATHFSGNGNIAGVEVLNESSTDAHVPGGRRRGGSVGRRDERDRPIRLPAHLHRGRGDQLDSIRGWHSLRLRTLSASRVHRL